jgi:lysophospholipase L1-like esterase
MRWTTILQNLLGTDYEVVSEGLPGRTFASVNPAKPFLTGITHLKSIIETHDPIDLMIVMLGTNDVKLMYNLTAEGIAKHLEETIVFIQKDIKNILVICPPEIIIPENNDLNPEFIKGPEISKLLPPLYKAVAEKYGCGFINAGEYIVSSKVDGFHLEPEAHQKLAEVVSSVVHKIYGIN